MLRDPRRSKFEFHPTLDEQRAEGKSLRDKCPRRSHAAWRPPHDRVDPLLLLQQSSKGRIPELIPIRHGRMLRSPFTFYRGSALAMAADLAHTPVTGLRAQLCGDAHLMNFGAFATPERRVIIDINDLDETLPGPWEWDVKRLAASIVLACRDNGFAKSDAREAVLACLASYRMHMAEFAQMPVLDVWYSAIDLEQTIETFEDEGARRRARKRLEKARARSVLEHEFPELVTEAAGGEPKIRENPPLIFHAEGDQDAFTSTVRKAYTAYRETLSEPKRVLLDRYKLMDLAIKVVGIGSVGTFCGVMLLMAGPSDPLFLQVKEARASVLEPYVGKSAHENHGQRVVMGCQLMQSASDLFLGWTKGEGGRHVYVRQLKDMKMKPMVELFTPPVMRQYVELCGYALAHGHARSGAPAKISGYLGKGDTFDEAIADFSVAYADQTERDYAVLQKAARSGKIEVLVEEP